MTRILMVCLGNICRSPLAEGILRSEVTSANVFIDSAGTSNYHIGQHPDKRSVENALKHHVDISKLKARQFTVKDFDDFDYIFVMDSNNYNDVISLARNEIDRQKVELILNRVYPNANIAVPDPYYGNEDAFENVFFILEKACESISNSLIALNSESKLNN